MIEPVIARLLVSVIAAVITLQSGSLGAPILFETGHGHPGHGALAEIEWNPDSQCLEIAVRVSALALERALLARDVDLDGPDAASAVHSYLSKTLLVQHPSRDTVLPMRWVGMELDPAICWIYVEIPIPDEPSKCRIAFLTLFDLFPEQQNLIEQRTPRGRVTQSCTIEVPSVVLNLQSPAKTSQEASMPECCVDAFSRLEALLESQVANGSVDVRPPLLEFALFDLALARRDLQRSRSLLENSLHGRSEIDRWAPAERVAVALRIAQCIAASGENDFGAACVVLALTGPHHDSERTLQLCRRRLGRARFEEAESLAAQFDTKSACELARELLYAE